MAATQSEPQTFMRKFYLWWEAMDAVRARRGEPPLGYEVARRWFECEVEPEDVPAVLGRHEASSDADRAFATRVKALLARPELTQVKLAERLGVTQSTISKWAKGEYPRHAHERRLHELERSLGPSR